MTAPTPWSIKGIGPEARRAAKAAAKRDGVTLGVWLTQRILEAGEDAERPPRRPTAASAPHAKTTRVKTAVAQSTEPDAELKAALDALRAEFSDRIELLVAQQQAHSAALSDAMETLTKRVSHAMIADAAARDGDDIGGPAPEPTERRAEPATESGSNGAVGPATAAAQRDAATKTPKDPTDAAIAETATLALAYDPLADADAAERLTQINGSAAPEIDLIDAEVIHVGPSSVAPGVEGPDPLASLPAEPQTAANGSAPAMESAVISDLDAHAPLTDESLRDAAASDDDRAAEDAADLGGASGSDRPDENEIADAMIAEARRADEPVDAVSTSDDVDATDAAPQARTGLFRTAAPAQKPVPTPPSPEALLERLDSRGLATSEQTTARLARIRDALNAASEIRAKQTKPLADEARRDANAMLARVGRDAEVGRAARRRSRGLMIIALLALAGGLGLLIMQ